MLYRDWDRFKEVCDALCRESDAPTRACIRWRHEAGLLVFKITDDRKCLTFKTRSSTYLNRFDALNRAMLRLYQNRRRPSPPPQDAGAARSLSFASAPTTVEAEVSSNTPGDTLDDGPAKTKKRRGKKKAK